jgi:hypothetical protein
MPDRKKPIAIIINSAGHSNIGAEVLPLNQDTQPDLTDETRSVVDRPLRSHGFGEGWMTDGFGNCFKCESVTDGLFAQIILNKWDYITTFDG